MTPMHRTLHQAAQRDRESEKRWSTAKSAAFLFCVALAFWLTLWLAWASS